MRETVLCCNLAEFVNEVSQALNLVPLCEQEIDSRGNN